MRGGEIVRQAGGDRPRPSRGQRGFSFIEILAAVGVLAAIGVVFIFAMNTAYRNVGMLDEKVQAEALARSQLENIKNSDYEDSGVYPVTVDLPPQYSMVVSAGNPTCVLESEGAEGVSLNTTTLQEIKVSVYRITNDGDRIIFSVACYKTKI